MMIPGMEITTEGGHANAWGIHRWHEFRCEDRQQMAQVAADVRASGALVSINHPKADGPPWTYGGEEWFDCLEVWQAPWFVFNDQSLELWDRLLREGHRLVAVGGSDIHQAPLTEEPSGLVVGQPCTWVYAEELSELAILAGIKAGHVFISEDPSGPRLSLTAEVGANGLLQVLIGHQVRVQRGESIHLRCETQGALDCLLRIRSIDTDLDVKIDRDCFRHECALQIDADTWFRAEVWDRSGQEVAILRALSNPIYFVVD